MQCDYSNHTTGIGLHEFNLQIIILLVIKENLMSSFKSEMMKAMARIVHSDFFSSAQALQI